MGTVYSHEDILAVLEQRDRYEYPAMSSGEIADELGASRPTVKSRLDDLEEQDKVVCRKIAGRNVFVLSNERLMAEPESDPSIPKPFHEGGDAREDLEDSVSLLRNALRFSVVGSVSVVFLGLAVWGVQAFGEFAFWRVFVSVSLILSVAGGSGTLFFTFRAWLSARDFLRTIQEAFSDGEGVVNEAV